MMELTQEDRWQIIESANLEYRKYQRRGVCTQDITEWDGIEPWVIEATVSYLQGKGLIVSSDPYWSDY